MMTDNNLADVLRHARQTVQNCQDGNYAPAQAVRLLAREQLNIDRFDAHTDTPPDVTEDEVSKVESSTGETLGYWYVKAHHEPKADKPRTMPVAGPLGKINAFADTMSAAGAGNVTFEELTDEGLATEWIGDLLTDLMHLCDQTGQSFDRITATAHMHHDAELAGTP